MRTFGACAMGRHTQRREVGGGRGGKRGGREGEGCGGRGRSESGEEGGYLVGEGGSVAHQGWVRDVHCPPHAPARAAGRRMARRLRARPMCACTSGWGVHLVGMHVTNQTVYRDPKGRQ